MRKSIYRRHCHNLRLSLIRRLRLPDDLAIDLADDLATDLLMLRCRLPYRQANEGSAGQ